MTTCKLEYLIKNIDIIPRKRLIFLFDKDSSFHFHEFYIKKLEEFKNMKPVYGDDVEAIMYEVAKDDDKKTRLEFEKIFREINQICIDNNTYPIFKEPSNIEECLKLREDLLKVHDEEELKKFFNVKSIRDYQPPLLRDVYYYPAVFKKEDKGYSVTVPDIFGGVTCGDSYEDALFMAKDMVKMMLKDAPAQCMPPKSLEETKKNFPDDIVVMIKVELERE